MVYHGINRFQIDGQSVHYVRRGSWYRHICIFLIIKRSDNCESAMNVENNEKTEKERGQY